MRDIGKNIRQLREQAGMTQEAFAEKLFVTRQTVSNYENGRTRPDLEMLVTIAEVLHADVNHLLYGVPTPPDKKRLIWQLIAGGAASALLITALTVLTPKALNFVNRSYLFAPIDLMRIVAAPAAFLTLGWTLMQILLVLGMRPERKKWCKTAKIVLLLLLLCYALVVVPYLSWEIWCVWKALSSGGVQSSFPLIPVYIQVLYLIRGITMQYVTTFFLFLPYGAAIRYFSFCGRES